MENKKKNILKKGILFGFFVLAGMILNPVDGKADGIDFQTKITQLQAKYPNGKYWNHVGMDTDNSDGYTDSPCTLHKAEGVSHVYGTGGCTCNHFADQGHLSATQCMGFANKLGHDIFGDTTWIVYNNPDAGQIATIRPGDIVRLNGSHSVFVISKNGNILTVGEANYPNSCQIRWNGTYNLSEHNITSFEHAANYDTVLNSFAGTTPPGSGEETPEEKATEEKPEESDFTGWRAAADGVHFQYFENGRLQKEKWLTLNKKKYYLDEQGYRVTGIYEISGSKYYFNSDGVMQKGKWVSDGNADYYVGTTGEVWTKQWLYKGNTLVYVKSDGAVAKNELVKIGSKTYFFDKKGKRSQGFKKVKNKYYYCDASGVIQKKKWVQQKGKSYYLQKNGVRASNKLVKIGKYKYYFNSKGVLQKNKKITYQYNIYAADKQGHCKLIGTAEE